MNKKLLSAIEEVKVMKGLDDTGFAQSIGMTPAGWSKKKRGLTKLTKNDLDAMVIAHPELTLAARQSIGAPDNDPAEVTK